MDIPVIHLKAEQWALYGSNISITWD